MPAAAISANLPDCGITQEEKGLRHIESVMQKSIDKNLNFRAGSARDLFSLSAVFLLFLLLLAGCRAGGEHQPAQGPVILNVSINLRLDEVQLAYENLARQFESQHPRVKVTLSFVRYDTQYRDIRARSGSTRDLDVTFVDLIWIPEFAEKKILRPLDGYVPPPVKKDMLPSALEAFTWRGRLWAAPARCYFQMLWYNEEMLRNAGFTGPPATIEELGDQMRKLRQKGCVRFPYVDAWNQQESLLCEYTWMTGAFGGSLFDSTGKPLFSRGAGLKALSTMVGWAEEGLIHPVSLAADETTALATFLRGEAAFTTSWVFKLDMMNDPRYSLIRGKARLALIPVSREIHDHVPTRSVSVSGFQGLAIMQNSRYPDEAWEFIRFVTSPGNSAFFADEIPLWSSVLNSEDTGRRDPYLEMKKIELSSLVHRPRLRDYHDISGIMQKYIHLALQGKMAPHESLNRAMRDIQQRKYPFFTR